MLPCNNLNSLIEKPTFEALNATSGESLDCSIKSTNDEQIIIRAAFQSPVKVSNISFRTNEVDRGPKNVKIFVNIDCPGFDDVEEMKAQQVLEVTKEQLGTGDLIPLRYVNFQNVRSIVLFVKDNQSGGETTEINQIVVWGCEEQSMDMKKWNPKKDEQAE